jgi:protein-L-isoaspartate O-methyltransferase
LFLFKRFEICRGADKLEAMNALLRLLKADPQRKTRLHTLNGYLCLNPGEILRSIGTYFDRVVLHRYSNAPWLTYSAVDYLVNVVPGLRVFEFGSGMSTLWFAERCKEVVSVENNRSWYEAIQKRTAGLENVSLIFAGDLKSYVGSIDRAGGRFDLILVDGMFRSECLGVARGYLNDGGMVIVDNTDAVPTLAQQARTELAGGTIREFRGWVPGNLSPNETTIVEKIPRVDTK